MDDGDIAKNDEIADLRERLERTERDRDAYVYELQVANELKGRMTSAAVGAASTTVTAIEHLQEAMELVDAAVEWAKLYNSHSLDYARACKELIERVEEHNDRVKARS